MLIKVVIASCMLSATSLSYAGFYTYSKDWPDDAASVDERVTSTAESAPAEIEVVTDDTTKEEYAPNERIDDYRRLYAKLGATFLSAQLRKITNVSNPTFSPGIVVNADAKQDYMSWEFGLGTTFKYVRLETEYLYEKNIIYNESPVFSNYPNSIASKVTTQAIWLTMLYDFKSVKLPYFVPYIGGSAGFVWNKAITDVYNLTSGTNKSHYRYALGWGGTCGIRIPFWTRWFGYFGYKYLDQGMVRWLSNSGNLSLKANSVVQGFDVGVQYLLG